MKKKTLAGRLAKVAGLALVTWPFLSSGTDTDQAKANWHLPEVGRCQASTDGIQGRGLDYDASGLRCVTGGGDCGGFTL